MYTDQAVTKNVLGSSAGAASLTCVLPGNQPLLTNLPSFLCRGPCRVRLGAYLLTPNHLLRLRAETLMIQVPCGVFELLPGIVLPAAQLT